MFSVRADWSQIARLKETVSIPVVGNGDVAVAGDVVRMMRETGCDGVMIGRASMKNPWIYRQAADLLSGRTPYEPTTQDREAVIRAHFAMVTAQEEPVFALHKLRTFTGWYTHGLPDGKRLRARIGELESPEAFLEAVDAFFEGGRRAAA
jgi:tRNA-dihydrouridine synthase B